MMYGHKKLLLPLILLGILGLLLFKSSVFAQTPAGYDVTVSPVFFDLSANPGSNVSDKLRIRNNTTSPIPIKIQVKRLTGDVNGDLTLNNENSDNSLSWIKFSTLTFVAQPLEWTDVPFQINIPSDAAYGYYYAISLTRDNSTTLSGNGAAITGAAAVPVLLNVRKAGAKAEGKVVNFSTKNFVNEYLPIDFNVRVGNTGNIHIRPHGNIFITDDSGKDVAILDVNNTQGTIIPSTQKTFNASWDDGFLVKTPVIEDGEEKLDKNGNPVEHLQINWNKLTSFRIGRYTANLLLVFDNGTRDVTLESSATFWVLPYAAIVGFIVFIIILIFALRLLLKSYINREVKRRSR